MPLRERLVLKSFFASGKRPSEGDFEDLIDSCINRIDDGFSKSADQAFQLTPAGNGSLLTFFKNTQAIKSQIPSWSLTLNTEANGLSFDEIQNGKPVSRLFIKEGGNVGIGTANPSFPLEVQGTIGMTGAIGTYLNSSSAKPLAADGEWKVLIPGLQKIRAFEVVAMATGGDGSGKHALLHAIVLSTFGKSKSAINKTVARFGPCRDRLEIRWNGEWDREKKGEQEGYQLQIRTRSNFGEKGVIQYHVKNLWDDKFLK